MSNIIITVNFKMNLWLENCWKIQPDISKYWKIFFSAIFRTFSEIRVLKT